MRIGVDLGGTKIEVAAMESGSGALRGRRRVATPQGDYTATVTAVRDLVRALERESGALACVGVAIPGAISPATGLVKNANSTWLIGKPFDQDLSQALERRVRVANDANCFALSEAADGAAQGASLTFGAILGTGVGGGVVFNGRCLVGRHAISGEWGHNPLPWPEPDELPGPPCFCGQHGCNETWLSGPALSAQYGGGATPQQIAELAASGDRAAESCLRRYETRLARGLASVINVVDPNVIVLGGGLSNLKRLYTNLPRLLPGYVFSDRVDTPIKPPVHGDSSGVRGAAWLWHEDEIAEGLPR